ncbi:zinc knuckle, partial [Ancylostoma caninum]
MERENPSRERHISRGRAQETKGVSSPGDTRPIRCFNCNGKGHLARECKKEKKEKADSREAGSLSARITDKVCGATKSMCGTRRKLSQEGKLFGKKWTTSVEIFGRKWSALLDTGSEVSILPARILKQAMRDGINIDEEVQELPLDTTTRVVDASGNAMKFLTVVRVDIKEDGAKSSLAKVSMHVSQGEVGTLVLGTNALPALGYRLVRKQGQRARRIKRDEKAAVRILAEDAEEKAIRCNAVVAERTYVAPGEMKPVRVTGAKASGDKLFCSEIHVIQTGLCSLEEHGSTTILVVNTGLEPLVYRKNQRVGSWDDCDRPQSDRAVAANMLTRQNPPLTPEERAETLRRYLVNNRGGKELSESLEDLMKNHNQVFAVEDRELTQTHLVTHEIDTGSTQPIRQKKRPVPIGARKEFKGIIEDLLNRGIIEPSSSDWASPVVLVRKKDGTLR